jgi:serine protease
MRFTLWLMTICFLLFSQAAYSLDTTTRPVGPIQSWSATDLERFNDQWLQVKFVEGADVNLSNQQFTDPTGLALDDVNSLMQDATVTHIRPTFTLDRARLRSWKAEGERRSGKIGPDLSLWYNIQVTGGKSEVARLINDLNLIPAVEIAHPVPIVESAVIYECHSMDKADNYGRLLRTPDWTAQQTYLYDPPVGLDAPAAWALPGGFGDDMKFIDVELCWTEDHEDFAFLNNFYQGGTTQNLAYEEHGTAVLGEVISQHNGFGVSGFAPAVEYGVVAIDIDLYPDVAQYFQEALNNLDAGDVWLIELQMYPSGREATPMEWLQVNYDVIWTSAWGQGVVCVEAGANGSQDLDDPSWMGVFDRNVRDSGAIMVGAGTPTGRVAEYFTNYGTRMDVHAWGSSIYTTGYGDLYDGGTLQTKYTTGFGGTSGASPMIVGASLCLQGIAKTYLGAPMTPEVLRDLLNSTGIAHLDPSKEIGPRPDLDAAAQVILAQSQNPLLAIQNLGIDDDDSGASEGNANGNVEAGEIIELTVTLQNMAQPDAYAVSGVLTSVDPYVIISSGSATYGTIPGGGTGVSTPAYVIAFDLDTPDQHVAEFNLAVTEAPTDITFDLTVGAPNLQFAGYTIDDSAGNNNGIAEPGEDVLLDLRVYNAGGGQIDRVWGRLSGGPYLTVDATPIEFGTLAGLATLSSGPFPVSVAADAPDPFTSIMVLDLTGENNYTARSNFNFNIGSVFASEFESGEDGWTHYVAEVGSYLDQWHLESYRNHSYNGATSWKCGGAGAADHGNLVYAALESPPFTLPGGSSLSFWHWIRAELSSGTPGYAYDGGLLEISIDAGPWEQLTPEGDYPYTIMDNNPLPDGTRVWSGTYDWSEVICDLSAYEGSARIRFLFVSDTGVTEEGWYIDDVMLSLNLLAVDDKPVTTPLLLHPALPNPAAPMTTLRLEMPRAGHASIRIYDATGRLTRTLVDGELTAGNHPLVWDGRDDSGVPATAGVYWARMRSANQPEQSTPIVIVR